jgi:hypothetical protein
VVTNGIVAGIGNIIKGKQNERQFANGFVAGGLARGGGTREADPYSFQFGAAPESDPGNLETGVGAEDPTLAGVLAQDQGGPIETPGGGIEARIADRDTQAPLENNAGGGLLTSPQQVQPAPGQQGLVARPVSDISGSPFQDRPADIRGLTGV